MSGVLARQVGQLLRFKRAAGADALAVLTGGEPDAVRGVLADLAAEGRVAESGGSWTLTPAGVAALDEAVADERAALPAADLAALYEEFRGHNDRLKAVVSAWQLRPGDDGPVVNDHQDERYDERVRRSLVKLDERFAPLLHRFSAHLPHLEMYGRRFAAAVDRLDEDARFIASPLIDSYHTVWFELHEELIAICGLDRRVEDAR
ncbi:hypothetical protein AB0L40_12320 [Patulibacter sp. NPDC049589]|uniref:hypothetical protein n=1 Tax=Patulibacter sp. NPDC049589 TaxID=3154731 RepID=UPI003413A9BC